MRKETSCVSLVRRRSHTTSYRKSILSIPHLHSETLNLWSHLFGTVWFCASATRFAKTATSLSSTNAAAIFLFLTANTFCFACSTLYHVFADHAEADSWLRLDHVGIVCAIWASSTSFVALSLGHHLGEQYVYMGSVTAAAVVCSYQLLGNLQHSRSERRSRISTYAILGSLAALPAFRCWYLSGVSGLVTDFGIMVLINALGGAIYTTDLLDTAIGMQFGIPSASHLTMHILAVVAALFYEKGLMSAYRDSGSKDDTLGA
jgi:adiponectin receptor